MGLLSQEQIKTKLLDFLKRMEAFEYTGPLEGFEQLRLQYAGEGAERFKKDVEQAAAVLSSFHDFVPIYRNLYDSVPVKEGLLLYESVHRFGGSESYFSLETAKHCNYGSMIPSEVYDWTEMALCNRAYTNLISQFLNLKLDSIDENGHLKGFCFNYIEFTYVLITREYDFLPVTCLDIYVDLANGGRLSLDRRFSFEKEFCPYEIAEDFLEEIINLDVSEGCEDSL